MERYRMEQVQSAFTYRLHAASVGRAVDRLAETVRLGKDLLVFILDLFDRFF